MVMQLDVGGKGTGGRLVFGSHQPTYGTKRRQ